MCEKKEGEYMKTMNDIVTDYPTLRAEIKKELSLREWTYTDLATKTGYSVFYIRSFMAGYLGSPKAAHKIVSVLGIPEYLAT